MIQTSYVAILYNEKKEYCEMYFNISCRIEACWCYDKAQASSSIEDEGENALI